MLWTRRVIATSSADVWRVFTDTECWPAWGPSVRSAALDDPGDFVSGATGTIVTALGPSLSFELTDVDPGRAWSWRVAGVPATSHRVRAVEGGTEASFGVPALVAPYLVVCAVALRRIEELALSTS